VRSVLTVEHVGLCFRVLETREKLIAKLAIVAGMRPGEIFALTWGRVRETFAAVEQRIYRGLLDSPKTNNSVRRPLAMGYWKVCKHGAKSLAVPIRQHSFFRLNVERR
jgi:hypothetical protein